MNTHKPCAARGNEMLDATSAHAGRWLRAAAGTAALLAVAIAALTLVPLRGGY